MSMSDHAWLEPTQELAPRPRPRGRRPVAVMMAVALVIVGIIAVVVSNAGTRPDIHPRRDAVGVPGTPTPAGTPAPAMSSGPVGSTDAPSTPLSASPPGSRPTSPNGLEFEYATFGGATGLQLNGSARLAGDRLVLGSGQNSAGSAWSTTRIDLTRSFVSSFTAQITKISDGVAFVIQSQSPTALGSPGGGLGYGQRPGDRGPAIAPSVAIELDTWDNSRDGFDPPGQHVAVTINGDITHHLIWSAPRFSLYGDTAMDVTVVYTATNHVLTVYVHPHLNLAPAAAYQIAPLFSDTIDLSQVVGTGPAYVGFTGGTGITTVTDPQESVNSWRFAEL